MPPAVTPDAIQRVAPEPLPGLALLGAGADTLAYRSGRIVVRASHAPRVGEHMAFEVKLLSLIADMTTLRVPTPLWLETRDGLTVMAHLYEPGEPLTLARFAKMSRRDQAAARDAIRQFCGVLHALDLGVVRDLGALDDSPHSDVAAVEGLVMPNLTVRERKRCWAALQHLDPDDLAMVHHDLAPDHLLCGDGALAAVIDFGDACVSQPIADVGGRLLGEYGRDFALDLLDGDGAAVAAAEAYALWDRLRGAAVELRSRRHSDALDWVRRELSSS